MSSVALWLGLMAAGAGLEPTPPTDGQGPARTLPSITIISVDAGPCIAQAGPDDDNPPPRHSHDHQGPGPDHPPGPGPGQPGMPPPPPGFLGGFFGPPPRGGPGPQGREALETKLENATYLGVYTESPDDTVRDQLGLDKGVGLVIQVLDPEGPAKLGGLLPHDILYKLDDQILINTAQLAVLVRNKKAGDAVQFTVIRKTVKTAVSVKLGEKMLPTLQTSQSFLHEMPGDVDNPSGRGPSERRWDPFDPPREMMMPNHPRRVSNVVIEDGKTILTFTTKEGHETLKVADETGKTVFEGPIDTPETREKLAPEYKKWLSTYDKIAHPKPADSASTQPAGQHTH